MSGPLRAAGALLLALAGLAGCSKTGASVGAADAAPVIGEARPRTRATRRPAGPRSPPRGTSDGGGAGRRRAAVQRHPGRVRGRRGEPVRRAEAGLSTGQNTRANLTLRAAPAGIARVMAKLRVNGGLVSESAESEDLAAPIVDAERQLAMAREYRDSLLALRARGSNDIKTLMSVNEELAKVQSTLESATGERAHLQQRIATETLTVSIATTGESEDRALAPLAPRCADSAPAWARPPPRRSRSWRTRFRGRSCWCRSAGCAPAMAAASQEAVREWTATARDDTPRDAQRAACARTCARPSPTACSRSTTSNGLVR